jgi:sulfite exporter TauE/SafE
LVASLMLGAWATALVGSAHCVGMCGPLVAVARGPVEVAAWQLGKLFTYAVVGAVVGGLGAAAWLPEPARIVVGVALAVVGAAQLAGLLPESWLVPWSRGVAGLARLLGRPTGPAGAWLGGALAGLLPCGLLAAAWPYAIAAGTVWGGALVLLAFGLGTVPALSAAGWISVRLGPTARRVLAVVALIAGLSGVATRATMAPESAACH